MTERICCACAGEGETTARLVAPTGEVVVVWLRCQRCDGLGVVSGKGGEALSSMDASLTVTAT